MEESIKVRVPKSLKNEMISFAEKQDTNLSDLTRDALKFYFHLKKEA